MAMEWVVSRQNETTSPVNVERGHGGHTPRPLLPGFVPEEFDALPQGVPIVDYSDLFGTAEGTPWLRQWASERGVDLRGLRPIKVERGPRTCKHLFALRDGYAVESVLIRRRDGETACISSQAGCGFGCRFCASGRAGLKRNLLSGEIVEQVVRLGRGVNRIVFMGIGEPLANYTQVIRAIHVLRDRRGMNFPTTGITISTIGIPSALKRLREEHLGINLTVSLHATTQQVRDWLIPGARGHALSEVVARALSWGERHGRTVTFAYLLLPGINDSPQDSARLAGMLRGRPARVNLMRWNSVEGAGFARIGDSGLRRFRGQLERASVPATVRDTQGLDASSACGQLWLRDARGRPFPARRDPARDR